MLSSTFLLLVIPLIQSLDLWSHVLFSLRAGDSAPARCFTLAKTRRGPEARVSSQSIRTALVAFEVKYADNVCADYVVNELPWGMNLPLLHIVPCAHRTSPMEAKRGAVQCSAVQSCARSGTECFDVVLMHDVGFVCSAEQVEKGMVRTPHRSNQVGSCTMWPVKPALRPPSATQCQVARDVYRTFEAN